MLKIQYPECQIQFMSSKFRIPDFAYFLADFCSLFLGVPVQVDGEAWLHPPGIIRILHKNRVQLVCRDKVSKMY